MTQNKSILIAGCGYVGAALAERLTALGWDVDGIRRSPTEGPHCFRPIYQDMGQPFSLTKPYANVFYLASAGGYHPENYDRAYRLGVQHLLSALGQFAKPDKLLFVSSTSVYSQENGDWVDETSPISEEGFAREALMSGERLVLQSGLPSVVVRFSGIYGPGRMSFRDDVLSRKRALVEPDPFTNRIHLDDCVGSLVHLMGKGKAREIYIASDSEPTSHNDVVRWLSAQGGVEPVAWDGSPGVKSPHRGNKRCSNQKLLATGYEFVHPSFRSGFKEKGS